MPVERWVMTWRFDIWFKALATLIVATGSRITASQTWQVLLDGYQRSITAKRLLNETLSHPEQGRKKPEAVVDLRCYGESQTSRLWGSSMFLPGWLSTYVHASSTFG